MAGRWIRTNRPVSLPPVQAFVSTWNILYTSQLIPSPVQEGEKHLRKNKKSFVTPLQRKRRYGILCLVKPTVGGQVKDKDKEGERR